MGVLKVRGTIPIAQFWPDGTADADTTKILVSVRHDSFSFSEDGRNFRVTHVFDDARVVGKSRGPVIRNDHITVRLQGVDAPELHYRAAALPRSDEISEQVRRRFNDLNKERRQHWAESATLALRRKLANFGRDRIECEAVSLVDHPHELVDTYGRAVANIRVGSNFDADINLWLAEEAWAVPTFYTSMTREEIDALLEAMRKGQRKGRVVGAVTGDTTKFDKNLLYRPHGEPQGDNGPLLMPKLFRRQVAYQMQRLAGVVRGPFKSFLARSPDPCFELEHFVDMTLHSAPEKKLDQFVQGARFTRDPHELVFKEKFSSVVDPQGRRLERF
jgi:endonuclease YncB( thermonuclease family)